MLKKIFIIILMPIFLFGCGYSKLYSDKDSKSININILKVNGDRDLNSYILSNLKRFSNKEGNKFNININTNYSISEISKDLKGSISNYQLTAVVNFEVEYDNSKKNITIQENFVMKNLSDNFEKKNYERSIKKNFGNSIVNKLILQITKIK